MTSATLDGRRAPRPRLQTATSEPDPSRQMLELLAESRRDGVEFRDAWRSAWSEIRWPPETSERDAWRAGLAHTRDEWQASYQHRPGRAGALRKLEGMGTLTSDPS